MSCKALGLILCTFFGLTISYAIAADYDETQTLRLYSSDADKSETIPPGNAIERSDLGGNPDMAGHPAYGDLGCCQACCCPRWTVTADALIWDRISSKSTTILGPLEDDHIADDPPGRLNSNDFAFGCAAGPRLSLIRHTECFDYEVVYFGIDGWSDTRFIPQSLNPASPLSFDWTSRLYNVELDMRWNPCCQLSLLAGFRWAELREGFSAGRILDSEFAPIGDISTTNDLYGFQVGADARIWQCGCFSINGLGKAGVYGNHAEQTSIFTGAPDIYSASTNHTAFIGELGLQARYQVTQGLAVRAGYELLWLDGVAIAPAQFNNIFGIDSNATVFYHGATVGMEYSF